MSCEGWSKTLLWYIREIIEPPINTFGHVQPMLDSQSRMLIIDLIKYHTLVYVYKCIHGRGPIYICIILLCRYIEYTATPPGRQI